MKVLRKTKSNSKHNCKIESTISRQRVKNQVRVHFTGKEELKTSRHKPDKMDPRESGLKSNVKKPRKYGNYGVIGQTKLQYTEPEYDIE